MNKKLVIIGGAGKGGPIAACVEHNRNHYGDNEYQVFGFLNDFEKENINGYPVLGKISAYKTFLSDPEIFFVFAIHQVQDNFAADKLFHTLNIPIDRYATIIHKSVVILADAIIEPGVVILAQSYISSSHLKTGTMVMPGVIVGHDAKIGPLAFLSLGSIIGSFAQIGRSAFIGMGANVIELSIVEEFAIVAAGAVVNSKVPAKTIYGGIPAKFLKDVK